MSSFPTEIAKTARAGRDIIQINSESYDISFNCQFLLLITLYNYGNAALFPDLLQNCMGGGGVSPQFIIISNRGGS